MIFWYIFCKIYISQKDCAENAQNRQANGNFEKSCYIPDSKVHGANMGPTWVLPSPGGPHVGPMNLAIRVYASLSQEK